MRNYKIEFLALLVGFGFMFLGSNAKADSEGGLIGGSRGWNYTHAGSSGSIFTGAGEVGGIQLSSGTSLDSLANYGVGIDTNATTNVTSVTSIAAQRVTPALIFESTTTVGDATAIIQEKHWKINDGDGKGYRVQNGFYWFPTASASGEAHRAIIKWRR